MAETFASSVAHLRAGVYTCAAGGTVLLYDIIITSEDEIRLIWASSFSLVKCLYFVNRYLPVPCLILGMYHLANLRGPLSTTLFVRSQRLTHNLTSSLCTHTHSCRLAILTQTFGQTICVIAAAWLLVIRVIALYARNKILAIALYSVFITTHLTFIIMTIFLMRDLWGSFEYLEYVGTCTANPTPLLGIGYFIPVGCEAVLVALQLFHAYQHTRRLLVKPRLPLTPLLRTLYADGFAYFMVIVTFRLGNAFIFIMADSSYWYILTYLEFALISTSVSRLVLHLRGAAEVHRHIHMNPGTSFQLSQLTQSVNPNIKGNDYGNPNRNSKFHNNQNRNGHQPPSSNHRYRRTPFWDHTLSSFQGTGETIQTHPSEGPQVHFSPLEHSSGAESIASMGTRV